MNHPTKTQLLGVGITNDSKQNILEYIVKNIENGGVKYYIVTPNPEILVFAHHHPDFKSMLNNAEIALADGVGLLWAARLLGVPLKQRVTGVDLMKSLCENVAKKPITVGFLGSGPGVAEKAAECLKKDYPGLHVILSEAWDPTLETIGKIREALSQKAKNSSGGPNNYRPIDVLFVAYGFPKQEEFIAKYLEKLPVRVAIGVGGALDYISGVVPRAPQWMRYLGFEWLYRLFRQPWRLKRQLALVEFVMLVFREKLGK